MWLAEGAAGQREGAAGREEADGRKGVGGREGVTGREGAAERVRAAEQKRTAGREGATGREALDLLRHIYLESHYQDALEAKGYRSPTWRILRALQAIIKANVVRGDRLDHFGDLSKGGE